MAFNPPTFPTHIDYWATMPVFPATPTPTGNLDGQVYINSKGLLDITPGTPDDWVPPIWVRFRVADFAASTCRVGSLLQALGTNCFVPTFYKVRWWEIIHMDFPNEYLQCLVEQCTYYGVCPDSGR